MSLSATRRSSPRAAPAMARSLSENSSPTVKPSLVTKPRRLPSGLASHKRAASTSPTGVMAPGFQANRSVSSPPALMTNAKYGGKGSRTVEDFDSEGNKENIAPFRVVSLTSPPRTRRSASSGEPQRAIRIYTNTIAVSSESIESGLALRLKSPRLQVISFARPREGGSESDRSSESSSDEERGSMANGTRFTRLTLSRRPTVSEKDGRGVNQSSKIALLILPTSTSDSSSDEGCYEEELKSAVKSLSLLGLGQAEHSDESTESDESGSDCE
ncbi:hypothetical protein D9611_006510 [Ephemerocybe angulata]|uniref:Uncharacterized protein n=1 Tax=Ephemerocybe angulata TaxID=980116 RepID=A0A8H5C933_9AGAR|nr:hypothetical protein D9611_006510 [Tulosesus angulatus]